MERSVIVARGGDSEFPRARMDANSPFRCAICAFIVRIHLGERCLPAGLFQGLWLVRCEPSSAAPSALSLSILPVDRYPAKQIVFQDPPPKTLPDSPAGGLESATKALQRP